MYEIIQDFRGYLESDCRYTSETVVSYLGNLPMIFNNMNIEEIEDIDSARISSEWQNQRWIVRDDGIELRDLTDNEYLQTLQSFLSFLEQSEYPVQQGVAGIIKVPASSSKSVRGLGYDEYRDLREHLLFNISNDKQRRETSVLFLLLTSGCSFEQAVNLKVHVDGLIHSKEGFRSGDFLWRNGKLTLLLSNFSHGASDVELPDEAAAFLQFYLENRNFKSDLMFCTATRGKVRRLTNKAIHKIVVGTFQKAGITTLEENIEAVLRQTAANPPTAPERLREVVRLSPEVPAENTNSQSWIDDGKRNVA